MDCFPIPTTGEVLAIHPADCGLSAAEYGVACSQLAFLSAVEENSSNPLDPSDATKASSASSSDMWGFFFEGIPQQASIVDEEMDDEVKEEIEERKEGKGNIENDGNRKVGDDKGKEKYHEDKVARKAKTRLLKVTRDLAGSAVIRGIWLVHQDANTPVGHVCATTFAFECSDVLLMSHAARKSRQPHSDAHLKPIKPVKPLQLAITASIDTPPLDAIVEELLPFSRSLVRDATRACRINKAWGIVTTEIPALPSVWGIGAAVKAHISGERSSSSSSRVGQGVDGDESDTESKRGVMLGETNGDGCRADCNGGDDGNGDSNRGVGHDSNRSVGHHSEGNGEDDKDSSHISAGGGEDDALTTMALIAERRAALSRALVAVSAYARVLHVEHICVALSACARAVEPSYMLRLEAILAHTFGDHFRYRRISIFCLIAAFF